MEISIHKLSKRFDTGWVFKGIDFNIKTGDRVAIKGPNGSGKSTLLNILCGYLSPSKGKVQYSYKGNRLDRDNIYSHLSISTVYTELDEELNPLELFRHYRKFKASRLSSAVEFINEAQLQGHEDKLIRNFSSGMKQRLSLALAITADVPMLFLDEPTSFLDDRRKLWFEDMMQRYAGDKTVIMASNDAFDLKTCTSSISLEGA